jgi:DNA polymerase-3 subunit gamma/tau
MTQYQVLARKYRPQTFKDVLNQDAIVSTLKNAIKNNRLAQAYLFCGSRGTGKTTLARILAKALNCQNLTAEFEPCNQCSSCKEITTGHSLDVLEIDGASNRGIDDIRQINETVGYAASSGHYKIYIIDEVHMLTKEAFNALLKTLEEPPPKVKFLFATTEAHKVLPTILSRCQRFNLKRISTEQIHSKLKRIANDLNVQVEDEALRLVATCADGGLRDAESLFDQVLAFHNNEKITQTSVAQMLGLVTKEHFFALDKAAQEGNFSLAFDISEDVFSQGKDLVHFVENLTEHFRNILVVKIAGKQASYLNLSDEERNQYENSAKIYSQENCLNILDFLVEAQNQIKFAPSPKTTLEALLLRIIRSQSRIPVDILIKRLADLEQKLSGSTPPSPPTTQETIVKVQEPNAVQTPIPPTQKEVVTKPQEPVAKPVFTPPPQKTTQEEPKEVLKGSVSEDPTPTRRDLGLKDPVTTPKKSVETPVTSAPKVQEAPLILEASQTSRFDTILQFAAIELEGRVQKRL